MTMSKVFRGSFAALVFAVLCLPAFAQRDRERYGGRGRWEVLGEAHVDGAADHDRIAVRGDYRAIRLRVEGGAINFERVVIHYADGRPEDIGIRHRIRSGEETRAIDLPGNRRAIESVEFWYSKDRWRSRPRVILYGLR
jgi:hypothetical protein